jgi:hypothetical protein
MIIWTEQSLLLAVIGSVGILTTLVVTLYSFRRNRTSNGRYQ